MQPQQSRPISRQLQDTKAFSGASLFFGILASAVCAAIIPALGAGRLATVGGAALSPLLVAMITTRGPGLVRSAGIAALSAVALIITIGGYTLPEAIAGHGSLTGHGSGTFVSTERTPEPTPPSPRPTTYPTPEPPTPAPTTPTPAPTPSGTKVEFPEIRNCREVKVGAAVTCRFGIRNAGSTTVEVATGEIEGDGSNAFTLTDECNGTLEPNSSCVVRLRFRPKAAGAYEASLIIYLQPGVIERRVTITGTATENTYEPIPDPTDTPSPTPSEPEPTVATN